LAYCSRSRLRSRHAPLAAPAIADQSLLKNADDVVSGHPWLTYTDLVRQAVPDLGLKADGHRVEGHFLAVRRWITWGEHNRAGLTMDGCMSFRRSATTSP
jgi:hypothetical protein